MITLEKHNPAVMTMTIPAKRTDQRQIMLSSDWHYDSTLGDLKLLTKHLRQAEEWQAPVLVAGDLLDVMQSHHDPRRSIEELKNKYAVASYLDAIVQDTAEYLAGFDIPAYVLALGNHETAILKNADTNLIDRIAANLRVVHKKNAISAGYWGYMRIKFEYTKGADQAVKNLYWHHGKSTSAPVTKGVIQVARQSVYLYDIDICLNGHNHAAYTLPVQVERLNSRTYEPYTETVWYVRTPGYKMSPGESQSVYGFGPEKHRAPTPRGCVFLDMQYSQSEIDVGIIQKIV